MLTATPVSALDWRDLLPGSAEPSVRDLELDALEQERAGDIDGAAEMLERALQAASTRPEGPPVSTLYNRATVAVKQGRYKEAIDGFQAALRADPSHRQARENLSIAEQLRALEQQPPDQGGGQQGDGQQGESQSGDGQGDTGSDSAPSADESASSAADNAQQGDQSSAANAQTGRDPADNGVQDGVRNDAQSNSTAERGNAPDDDGDAVGAGASAEQREQEANEAAAALAAEADADEQLGGTAAAPAGTAAEEPLSEREQATEQWLRRIPDDPAGLLRRKLEQNHLTDYPEVRSSDRRW